MEQTKLNKMIFYSTILIIVILLAFNLKLNSLKADFDEYCVKDYNISSPCPCISDKDTKNQSFMLQLQGIENLSASSP